MLSLPFFPFSIIRMSLDLQFLRNHLTYIRYRTSDVYSLVRMLDLHCDVIFIYVSEQLEFIFLFVFIFRSRMFGLDIGLHQSRTFSLR